MVGLKKGRGVFGNESAICSQLRQFVHEGPCAGLVNQVVYR